MKIAVVIPVHNRREITLNCLGQLAHVNVPDAALDIIVVDDGSTDGTSGAIRERFPHVTVISGDGNLWWTGAIRVGVERVLQGDYDYVLTLNDDVTFDANFLSQLLLVANANAGALVSSIKLARQTAGAPRVIAAGFRVQGMLQEIRPIGGGILYDPSSFDAVIHCDALTGASLLIPTKVFRQIGSFDSQRYPHGFGDFEFTRRASLAGFACLVATRSIIITDNNQNYHTPYFLRATRGDYLKNLFDTRKYNYGYLALWKYCFLHHDMIRGFIFFLRRSAGLTRFVLYKIFLPKKMLMRVVDLRQLNSTPKSKPV